MLWDVLWGLALQCGRCLGFCVIRAEKCRALKCLTGAAVYTQRRAWRVVFTVTVSYFSASCRWMSRKVRITRGALQAQTDSIKNSWKRADQNSIKRNRFKVLGFWLTCRFLRMLLEVNYFTLIFFLTQDTESRPVFRRSEVWILKAAFTPEVICMYSVFGQCTGAIWGPVVWFGYRVSLSAAGFDWSSPNWATDSAHQDYKNLKSTQCGQCVSCNR